MPNRSDAPVAARGVLVKVVAAACAGAGLVHLAFAPSHLQVNSVHGAFFVVVAWLQLGLAWALLTAPTRRPLALAAVVVNLAVLGVWIASRAVGIDGPPEAVGFPDLLASAFEVVVVAGASMLAADWHGPRLPSGSPGILSGAAVAAVVALVSASVAPALGGGHTHDETAAGHVHAVAADGSTHDHDHTAAKVAAAGHAHDHTTDTTDATSESASHDHSSTTSGTSTHDHTSGTTTTGHDHTTDTTTGGTGDGHDHGTGGGGGTTTDNWEAIRYAALMGGVGPEELAAVQAASSAYLGEQLRNRSGLLQGLSDADREARIATYTQWQLEHALDAEHGGTGNHTHGPSAWIDLPPDQQRALQTELANAATVIRKYPTAADAMAGGYMQVTPWIPGIGAHYLRGDRISAFDPAKPSILLYNGNSPTSVLVGVSYAILGGDTPPEGFTGPNDVWHEHPALCLIGAFVVGVDATTPEMCASVGGSKGNGFGGGHFWMMHLWQVPGWESSWGLFSGESPAINMARTDVGH